MSFASTWLGEISKAELEEISKASKSTAHESIEKLYKCLKYSKKG